MRPRTLCPLLLLVSACGGTEGAFVQPALTVQADLPTEANEFGWTVELTRARLAIGPVRFYEGEPLFAAVAREALHLAFGFREARAHPGHYAEGAALAEWLETETIDLLSAAPHPLGQVDGVTGVYRSAELTLAPGPEGATVELEGVARRGADEVEFSVTVEHGVAVRGVAFGAEISTSAPVIGLRVDLEAWLARMDFDAHPGGALELHGQPLNALSRGIEDVAGYRFELASEAQTR